MLKGICIIVICACVGAMIYSIVNAISVSKRNKAADEATRQLFLAKMAKEMNQEHEEIKPKTVWMQQPETITSVDEKPTQIEPEEEQIDTTQYSLKDFFKAD